MGVSFLKKWGKGSSLEIVKFEKLIQLKIIDLYEFINCKIGNFEYFL